MRKRDDYDNASRAHGANAGVDSDGKPDLGHRGIAHAPAQNMNMKAMLKDVVDFFFMLLIALMTCAVVHQVVPCEFWTAKTNVLIRPETTNVQMSLSWMVSTNWAPSHQERTLMLPESANTTTFYERGSAYSNLVGTFEWKGKIQMVLLESVLFAECQRSYTESMERRYGNTRSWPATFSAGGSLTNFIGTNVLPEILITTNDHGLIELRSK